MRKRQRTSAGCYDRCRGTVGVLQVRSLAQSTASRELPRHLKRFPIETSPVLACTLQSHGKGSCMSLGVRVLALCQITLNPTYRETLHMQTSAALASSQLLSKPGIVGSNKTFTKNSRQLLFRDTWCHRAILNVLNTLLVAPNTTQDARHRTTAYHRLAGR